MTAAGVTVEGSTTYTIPVGIGPIQGYALYEPPSSGDAGNWKIIAWRCSTMLPGLGYGGAVTQATSRTTGVTLNKPYGASDVVRVVQKSGTDKYIILVTAVGAGSFEITFATTGGTTTEQPVFNFVVQKAVAT
jgi:hypothetical protein